MKLLAMILVLAALGTAGCAGGNSGSSSTAAPGAALSKKVAAAVDRGGPPLGPRAALAVSHARCTINLRHGLGNGDHIALCTATVTMTDATQLSEATSANVPIEIRLNGANQIMGVVCGRHSESDPYCRE